MKTRADPSRLIRSPDDRRPRILHVVVEAGSGVVAVVEDHIANAREFEHHVLVALDDSCSVGDDLEHVAASITRLPAGLLARARALRRAVERLDPRIIHAHSSFAGAYARAVLPRRRREHVVFTPHCYAFERNDLGRASRVSFRLAEVALSFRGHHVAACSPREATLASGLPGHQLVTYVPNVARASGRRAPRRGRRTGSTGAVVAASVGRISPQKAPEMFGDAARRSRARDLDIDWVWIGGSGDDPAGERALRRAGVRVTGWIGRADARTALAAADVYVHCATWEGAPLTVLEAAMAGVPVVARRSSALEALGVAPLYDTVDELLDILGQFPDGPAFADAERSIAGLRDRHTDDRQREALMHVYRRAAAGLRR